MKQEEASRPSIHSEELFRLVAENVEDFAVFAIDLDGNAVSWNKGVEKLLGYTEAEWVGRDACMIFTPEDNAHDACAHELSKARDKGRAEDRRWHLRKDGSRFWANGLLMALRDDAGTLRGFAKIMRDETAQKLSQEKLEQTNWRVENILSSISDSFYTFDREFRYVYVNEATTKMFDTPETKFLGKTLWDLFPDVEGNQFHKEVLRAFNEQTTIVFENYYPPLNRWFENRVYPSPEGLSVFTSEITARKQAELNQKVLFEVAEKIRRAENAEDLLFALAQIIGEHLQVRRCLFNEIDLEQDRETVHRDYCRGTESVAGVHPISDYSSITTADIQAGKTVVNRDSQTDSRTAEFYERTYAPVGERAYVAVPLLRSGRWVASLWVSDDHPRDWSDAEISLLETVAERAWLAVEKLRSEATLRASEERYRTLFSSMDEGFCVIEVIFDEGGRAIDYRFLEINPSFEKLTGIPADDALLHGKTVRELVPNLERRWFEIYGRVAQTGEAVRLTEGSEAMNQWFDVYAFRVGEPEERRVAILFNNVTERKQVEHERERLLVREQEARRQAEDANRLKDEFLATLSHELRTPLTSILGWARMLQTSNFDKSAATRALTTIERNARAQTQLIDDLLDTSRIITGKLRLDVRAVDLAGVVASAADTARPAAEAKNIRLQTLLDPHAGPVSGDPDRLQQVVWNLLSNAIKFTPKDGRVQVRLERVNSHVEITVGDTGRGIAPEFLPHVFDRFRQADGTTTRAHGGLGLGLAIVRQLVELHGGTVHVESRGEGQGTTFTVKLPLLPVRTKATASDDERRHPTADTSSALHCPPQLDGLRVLVVDDEPDTLELFRLVLENCAARVVTAASAAEALDVLQRERPDVLVSDIGMPEEDGYSLIAKVRALPAERGGKTPAAALTAYARTEDRLRILRSGFQSHVSKPVEPAELVTVVANLAGRVGVV